MNPEQAPRRALEHRPSRRGLLGYVGAGGVGLVVGAATGAALTSSGQAPPGVVESATVPVEVSPYGVHQPGVFTPTPRANRLLALDLRPEVDADALGRLMRLWSGDIEAFAHGRPAPGDTAADLAQAAADLTVTVGWGPRVFDLAGLGPARPPGLVVIPPMKHDRLVERWSGGDLLLQIGAADDTTVLHAVRRLLLDARPFAELRWEQEGSWRGLDRRHHPTTGRNLFGQVDGTANPTPQDPEFADTVWAAAPDWFVGGTTLVVRRIQMDLDTWDELTRAEQEDSIGRDLATGAPLTGGHEHAEPDLQARAQGRPVIAANAHVRLSHPSVNGGRRIVRRGLNYTGVDPTTGRREAGLIFSSFQADIGDQFVPLQRRLDAGDSLNTWTTAIGSAVFAVLPGFRSGGWLGDSLLGD